MGRGRGGARVRRRSLDGPQAMVGHRPVRRGVGWSRLMAVHISRPRNDPEGLDELAPLWKELHRHHREVADYQPLVADFELSWTSRLALYRRLLADGGCYLIASTDGGDTIGYAMVTIDAGPDDTFDVT